MSLDGQLPPGVTDRQIAEHGLHDLQRCVKCSALMWAATLDKDGVCYHCTREYDDDSKKSGT